MYATITAERVAALLPDADAAAVAAWVNERRPLDAAEAERMAAFRVKIATVLAAPLRTVIDGLRVQHRGWPTEVSTSAPVQAAIATALAAPAGDDTAAYAGIQAALGAAHTVTLTGDGRPVGIGWCICSPGPAAADWVRYERFTDRGMDAHGYVCPTCRNITQTG